ncbi:class I SAM-dependent methyltransferase [Candidatus Microgenomates bacterium]|nr:class I SAM-dependent methyltransferase [Candidatus Microgenomates bacterium]
MKFFIKRIIEAVGLEVRAIMMYLSGEELAKYSDCRLLWKLKAQQPPGSDRYLEYPWMAANLQLKRGRLLDVGSTATQILDAFLPRAVKIYGIDLNAREFSNKKINLVRGDIRQTSYPNNYFDEVVCISVLEHVGVAGRYSSDDDPKGDLKAMQEIRRVMKKGATLLLTVPYGIRDVLPINRLYNKTRLGRLLKGFQLVSCEYRKFNTRFGFWFVSPEKDAAKTDMLKDRWYAVALVKAIKK